MSHIQRCRAVASAGPSDLPSQAECGCGDGVCPRHEPTDYTLWGSQHRELTPSDQDLP